MGWFLYHDKDNDPLKNMEVNKTTATGWLSNEDYRTKPVDNVSKKKQKKKVSK